MNHLQPLLEIIAQKTKAYYDLNRFLWRNGYETQAERLQEDYLLKHESIFLAKVSENQRLSAWSQLLTTTIQKHRQCLGLERR